jgi:putative addiction module component (TIGR02574 family)
MSPDTLRDQIMRLPPAERLRLVEEIWDSLTASPDEVPVPDWHRAEVERRLTDPSEEATLTWEQVREKPRR